MGKKAQLKRSRKESRQASGAITPLGHLVLNKRLEMGIVAFLLLVILAIAVLLRVSNLDVPRRSPDERIYAYQAGAIAQRGTDGIKVLLEEYNSDNKMWVYPPPIRAGYLWPLAAFMKLINSADEKAGVYLSLFFTFVSLLLLIVIGLRFFNKWITLFALLFLSVSPMDLAIARRCWQDAMLGSFGLILVYLCCEITRAAKKTILYALLIIIGSYCILIKESGSIIYGLCIIWVLWILIVKEKSVLGGSFFILCSILGISASAAILAYSAGGLPVIIEVIKHVKEAMPLNQYAIDYQSGPWYNIPLGLWIVSPVSSILCLAGVIGTFLEAKSYQKIAVSKNNKTQTAIFGIIFFTIAFLAIAIITPYCQNLRYISVLYVPFYLIAALGLWYIISLIKAMAKNSVFLTIVMAAVVLIIISAFNDYKNFKKIFVRTGILDVSIRMLKECSR